MLSEEKAGLYLGDRAFAVEHLQLCYLLIEDVRLSHSLCLRILFVTKCYNNHKCHFEVYAIGQHL